MGAMVRLVWEEEGVVGLKGKAKVESEHRGDLEDDGREMKEVKECLSWNTKIRCILD